MRSFRIFQNSHYIYKKFYKRYKSVQNLFHLSAERFYLFISLSETERKQKEWTLKRLKHHLVIGCSNIYSFLLISMRWRSGSV